MPMNANRMSFYRIFYIFLGSECGRFDWEFHSNRKYVPDLGYLAQNMRLNLNAIKSKR